MNKILLLAFMILARLAEAAIPLPGYADRVRLAEAFSLADSVQESVWKGWSAVPFVVLLVTEEHEYLLRHPYPPDDFVSLGRDEVTGEEIFARENDGRYSLSFLATFPAVQGVNTVVVGQPGHTGKTSTEWVITLLHEHFHQLQYTQPWYYEAVENLGLSGGDTSGMWQLNYPFPYESADIGSLLHGYGNELLEALDALPELNEDSHRRAWRALKEGLDEADYSYMSFQLWQEGVARHTELAVAREAAKQHIPSPKFEALDDYLPYGEAYHRLNKQLRSELQQLDLANWKRVVFYPLGAAEALWLDQANPDWKEDYFSRPFDLEQYLD